MLERSRSKIRNDKKRLLLETFLLHTHVAALKTKRDSSSSPILDLCVCVCSNYMHACFSLCSGSIALFFFFFMIFFKTCAVLLLLLLLLFSPLSVFWLAAGRFFLFSHVLCARRSRQQQQITLSSCKPPVTLTCSTGRPVRSLRLPLPLQNQAKKSFGAHVPTINCALSIK